MKLGSIDIGSNSLHLAVAEIDASGKLQVLEVHRRGVRLVDGWATGRGISKAALTTAIAGMLDFLKICETQGCQEVIATGTSPLRQSPDTPRFIEELRRQSGLEVRVLSGEEEARMMYLGVKAHLPSITEASLLFDLGGGSLELALGDSEVLHSARSLPVGYHRLLAEYPHSDPPMPEEQDVMMRLVRPRLEPVMSALSERCKGSLLSPSSSVGTLARMAHAQREGVTPASRVDLSLSVGDLDSLVLTLGSTPRADLPDLPGMDPRRCDTLFVAALLTREILLSAQREELRTCEGGIRTGILEDWTHRHRKAQHGEGT